MGDGDVGAADDAFVPLKFDGGRYRKPGYPLETAAELANYQKLLIEVAKQECLAQNSDRERGYKGFEDSLELRLTRVEVRSVVPYTVTGKSNVSEFVDDVREAIRDLFAFVVEKKRLPTGLRDGVRDAMKRIDTTLRDDEALFVKATSFGGHQVRIVPTTAVEVTMKAPTSREDTGMSGPRTVAVTVGFELLTDRITGVRTGQRSLSSRGSRHYKHGQSDASSVLDVAHTLAHASTSIRSRSNSDRGDVDRHDRPAQRG